MKYKFMLFVALCLAIFSSVMTALGMVDLFSAAGTFILILFIVIDLGRFVLFNFVVDDWKNLRGVKYPIVLILILLFGYSAVGIYSKLDALVSPSTRQAMVLAASSNKAESNASIRQTRSEDFAKAAQTEYDTAIDWNTADYTNCMTRAQSSSNIPAAENTCNNTKRRLDKNALSALKTAMTEADEALSSVEDTVLSNSENQSEIASILTSLCKVTGGQCDTYSGLQDSLTLLILLVIVGTDYLQIAIILAVNTRRNKICEVEALPEIVATTKIEKNTKKIEEITENINPAPDVKIDKIEKPAKTTNKSDSTPQTTTIKDPFGSKSKFLGGGAGKNTKKKDLWKY